MDGHLGCRGPLQGHDSASAGNAPHTASHHPRHLLDRRTRMAKASALRAALRVEPGQRIQLDELDHGATHGWDKASAAPEIEHQRKRLADLQDRVWAEGKHAVLVVLQGIDAAGKDGTIKHVLTALNPQGTPVTAFKVPSPEELGHDYLW